jgi:transmembrane 9 superfamily protein 2/4
MLTVVIALSARLRHPLRRGSSIHVIGTRIGLPSNPSSFLSLYQVGFLLSDRPVRLSYSDLFLGTSIARLGVSLTFATNTSEQRFAILVIDPELRDLLTRVVQLNYSLEVSVDGLRSFCPVGTTSGGIVRIFRHFHFTVGWSGSRIVSVQINLSELIGAVVTFSYSSEWHKTKNRARVLDKGFFRASWHVVAVVQPLVEAIVVSGVIEWICSRLVVDTGAESAEVGDQEWKIIQGDVFRPPRWSHLLAVIGGSSLHITTFVLVLIVGLMGASYEFSRLGLTITAYLLTAIFAGIGAVCLGNSFGIRKWLRLAFGAVPVCPILWFILEEAIKKLARFVGSGYQLIARYGLVFFALLLLPLFLMAAVGGFVAVKKQWLGDVPCQVSAISRSVPKLPFYAHGLFLAPIIGFFSARGGFIEIFYILSAHWQSQIYCSYYLLLATVLLLIVNTGGFTVLAVFVRLHCQCYSWHWFSFLAPSFSGVYSLICCAWFYDWRVRATDIFTPIYFTGISVALSLIVAMICGTSGLVASNWFVRLSFADLKLD